VGPVGISPVSTATINNDNSIPLGCTQAPLAPEFATYQATASSAPLINEHRTGICGAFCEGGVGSHHLIAGANASLLEDALPSDKYSSGSSCSWTITAPAGCRVALQFCKFQTEGGYDFVTLTNGEALLARLTGSEGFQKRYMSVGNQLGVSISTDTLYNYEGFTAYYYKWCSLDEPPSSVHLCPPLATVGATVTPIVVSIETFKVRGGTNIGGVLSVDSWNTGVRDAFTGTLASEAGVPLSAVTLRNVSFVSSSGSLETHVSYDIEATDTAAASDIGTKLNTSFTDPSNGGFVQKLDSAAEARGEDINPVIVVTAQPVSTSEIITADSLIGGPPLCAVQSSMQVTAGGVLIEDSPDADYMPLTSCRFDLSVPFDKCAKISFLEFETELLYDSLRLYMGTQELGHFTGAPSLQEMNRSTVVPGANMRLQFETDAVNNRAGFKAKAFAVPCQETFASSDAEQAVEEGQSITQTMTMEVPASEYKGQLQLLIEEAYGAALGLYDYVPRTWCPGCMVTSGASGRAPALITLTTTAPEGSSATGTVGGLEMESMASHIAIVKGNDTKYSGVGAPQVLRVDRPEIIDYSSTAVKRTGPAFYKQSDRNALLDLIHETNSSLVHSAPFFADIDGDGLQDAVIGFETGDLKYMRNIGSKSNPSFVDVTGAQDPFAGLNRGRAFATPVLVDVDQDGDLDLFVGGEDGFIHFFRNNQSATNPVYSLDHASNPFGGNIGAHSAASFGDIDGDGDLDAFVGSLSGGIDLYRNQGNTTYPVFIQESDTQNPMASFKLAVYLKPCLIDLDQDHDLDLFVGDFDGNLHFFQNIGSRNQAVYQEAVGATNPLNVAVYSPQTYEAPAFVDIDGDNRLDAFVGNKNGNMTFIKNVGYASLTIPIFTQQLLHRNPFSGHALPYPVPAFADLDGDGDYDAFVGNDAGRTVYIRNYGTRYAPLMMEQISPPKPQTHNVHYVVAAITLTYNGTLHGQSVNLHSIFDDSFKLIVAKVVTESGVTGSENGLTINGIQIHNSSSLSSTGASEIYFTASSVSSTLPDTVGPILTTSTSDTTSNGFVDLLQRRLIAAATSDSSVTVADGLIISATVSFCYSSSMSAISVNRFRVISPPFSPLNNPFDDIEVPSRAHPVFVDIDDDGDQDVYIGSQSAVWAYENIGSNNTAIYIRRNATSFDLFYGVTGVTNCAPYFLDMDGDGDLDALLGLNDSTVRYYENTGSRTSPILTVSSTTFFAAHVSLDLTNAAPACYDVDDDGDFDCFIGLGSTRTDLTAGKILFYRNIGTKYNAAFILDTGETSPFKGVSLGNNPKPIFVDIDNDGDQDAFVGDAGSGAANLYQKPDTREFVIYLKNFNMESWCMWQGSFDTTIQRCMCFAGFYGRQCAMSCPGPGSTDLPPSLAAENTCYRHGACYSSGSKEGECLCQKGYAGIDSLGRVTCDDCLISNDTMSPSYYGSYGIEFGKDALTGKGLPLGLNLVCNLCPGGGICSGHGACDAGKSGSGVCSCVIGYGGPACEIRDRCNAGYASGLDTPNAPCRACRPGKAASSGQSSCIDCEKGKYADVEGSTTCKPCAPGKYTELVGQTKCVLCEKGTHAPSSGMQVCPPCVRNYFSTIKGATECEACPLRGTTALEGATSFSACVCTPQAQFTMRGGVCSPCAAGFDCGGTGPVTPKAGYWLPAPDQEGILNGNIIMLGGAHSLWNTASNTTSDLPIPRLGLISALEDFAGTEPGTVILKTVEDFTSRHM